MQKFTFDRAHVEEITRGWIEATEDLSPERPKMPLHVLLGDAVDLATFVETHYEPAVVGGVGVPGLSSVESVSGVSRETARELLELQAAIAHLDAEAGIRKDLAGAAPLDEADRILAELRAALGFLLDGSGDAEGEHSLRRLRELGRGSRAHDAVALLLEHYAALADRYAERLASIGIESEISAAARREAAALRDRSAAAIRERAATEMNTLIVARDRLVRALHERLRLVRRAIRYVFREHPELTALASSESRRLRRRPTPAEDRQAIEPEPALSQAS